MYQEERMQLILEHLNENKRISVEEICNLYNVSRDTARRDLVNLERQGSILRTHGGAILPKINEQIKSYSERLLYDIEEKHKIAKLGASLVKERDTVIFDTSTTVQACAELIENKQCTVITTSINVADIISKKTSINIIMPGGRLNSTHRFLYGAATIKMLSNYFADRAFIGVLGISENGITVADDEDAAVTKKMIEQSREVIILADHTKFNKTAVFKVCDLSEIDFIITDKQPEKSFMELLDKNNIGLIIAE
ncbi:DeoR/GlpR family DNA-binding transcription regulator [Clostridium sp. DJ247]|uniref:DeoR/GlpR family DNA-binding transcription regulator n=1 Tax=Clostridium sp. DJ247 TaxID=2726188 RepID=UPI0016260E4F|nr:DeoR/GlpR family DNA-binding transcription regulator [Clostridium sp. DJ247]MBC2581289.1 DeoR/GlpR transcriptional regulator [Clostridium sp. DJ247]